MLKAVLRRVSSHTKDADFNAQRFAKEWEAITYDTEVRTNPPTNQAKLARRQPTDQPTDQPQPANLNQPSTTNQAQPTSS